MTILITGSNGFLGKHLVKRCQSRFDLVLFNRVDATKTSSHKSFNKNINSKSDYSGCFEGVSCIVHCAARVHIMSDQLLNPLEAYREVNTNGTLNLARQAIAAGVRRFVFISSIKVNGEATNTSFDSCSPRLPADYYAQSKSEAEEALMALSDATGLEVVIIRPPLVYGAGVKANFASLMGLVYKGYPLPFGCINSNYRSLVSVNNLVDLIITCIDHPKAANEVFLVSDDRDISTANMVRQMSKAFGKSCYLLPVPVWCYRLFGKVFDKEDVVDRIVGSLRVDMSFTKSTLDWKPPQSLEDGFKEVADHIKNNQGVN